MQLFDNYPTDNVFKLFQKIEENIEVLMFAFDKTSLKDRNAITRNIHYTIVLPIFRQVSRKDKLDVKSLNIFEKRLITYMLTNSTTLFCLGALMLHSKQLTNILHKGFNGQNERIQLLNFVNDAVVRMCPSDRRVITGVSSSDATRLLYISTELYNRHNLGVLFK